VLIVRKILSDDLMKYSIFQKALGKSAEWMLTSTGMFFATRKGLSSAIQSRVSRIQEPPLVAYEK
jgi:hypothetical protein